MANRRRGLRQKNVEKGKLECDSIPGVKMEKHHDKISANIPKFRRAMYGGFQKIVHFHALITAFRGSSGMVKGRPLIAATRRGVIKSDIGLQRKAGYVLAGKIGTWP